MVINGYSVLEEKGGLGAAFLICGGFGEGYYGLWVGENIQKSLVRKMGNREGMA
jgi:hypothetical protein